jgi:hypothetical protein
MSDTFERKVISPAEREARKAFKEVDAAKAMTEHDRAQKAFHDNRERLKALRLPVKLSQPRPSDFELNTQRCLKKPGVRIAERDAGE